MSLKRLVVDLDGTLTRDDSGTDYADKRPNLDLIEKLRAYRDDGFTIVVYAARNMRTFDNSVGKINAHTLPVIIDWLRRYDVPFDEVHVGNPWCGSEGLYVDDRAIRPSEFMSMLALEIADLIARDAGQDRASPPESLVEWQTG